MWSHSCLQWRRNRVICTYCGLIGPIPVARCCLSSCNSICLSIWYFRNNDFISKNMVVYVQLGFDSFSRSNIPIFCSYFIQQGMFLSVNWYTQYRKAILYKQNKVSVSTDHENQWIVFAKKEASVDRVALPVTDLNLTANCKAVSLDSCPR